MGILDLHAAEAESAATNARVYAPARQEPAFSVWSLGTAIPRGAVAGIGEMGASIFDIASGLAVNLKRLRDAGPDQMREFDKRGTVDIANDFRSDFGRAMRDEAASWMPDPMTAHSSVQTVAEFARMIGKVAATIPFAGPLGAAGIVGAEEGFTASDKLAEDGVDFQTRANVGAVTAGVTAATFALPIAGKTVGQTVGLALGGGPVAFVGQQAATREILQRADYSKLADRYDPFDPLGLALSTLLPLGFGAVAMRAASKAKAKQSAADAAKAEADFMAGPIPSERSAISRAVDLQTEDAARVALLREVSEQSRLTPADDLAGAAAHEAALAKALDQIGRGERVDVGGDVDPWINHVNDPAALPPIADIADDLRILGKGAGWAQVGGSLIRKPPDAATLNEAELRTIHMQGEPIGRTKWIPFEPWFAQMRSELANGGLSKPADIETAIEKAVAGGKLSAKESRTVEWMSREVQAMRSALDAFSPESARALAEDAFDAGLAARDAPDLQLTARAAELDPERVEDAARKYEDDDSTFMAEMQRIVDEHTDASQGAGAGGAQARQAAPAASKSFAEFVAAVDKAAREAGTEARRAAKTTPAATTAKPSPVPPQAAGADTREQAQGLARAAADLEAVNPDLLVRLDGMDEAVPLSELMQRIKDEAAQDAEQAKWVEAAATCALRAGL